MLKIDEEIKKKLIEQGYSNKKINYQQFLELYKPYQKSMSEAEFANILGISSVNLSGIKSRNSQAIILKTKKKKIVLDERKSEIKTNLRQQGYANKEITLKEFLELYEQYKQELSKSEFAAILDFPFYRLRFIEKQGAKAIILKDEALSDEQITEIKITLKKQGYSNKAITYQEFLKLYEPYKSKITELEFANNLGISTGNFYNIKYKGSRAIILRENKDSLERIKYILRQENRYYTKEELSKLCNEYGITIQNLILYLYNKKDYLTTLEKTGSLFIGVCKMDKNFQKKYATELLNIVSSTSQLLSQTFTSLKYAQEDISSDTLLYILSNKGDIVLNSSTEKIALSHIKSYVYRYEKHEYLKRCASKTIPIDKILYNQNIDELVEQTEENGFANESILDDMQKLYDSGIDNQETINKIIEKHHITKEELLEILETELSKRRKILKDKDNNFYLGEEL